MDFEKLISKRLGGVDFYKNGYYKFEKYTMLKQEYKKNNSQELLDFGIGESYDLPPSIALDELSKNVFKKGSNIYADNGIDEYKKAASIYLQEVFNLKIDDYKNQINHVMGAKSALCILPLALIDENDIIITTTPGYDVLANMGSWLNAKIYKAPLLKCNNYLPNLDIIPEEVYKQTKIFIINYPNNPTGAIANKKFYEKLIEYALKYEFLIINDNTYGPLTYKDNPLSIMSIPKAFECAIEIHSMSKAFNMTGFRIGFVVGDNKIIDIIKKVKDNVDSGQYIPIQLAASQAIHNEKEFLKRLKSKYYIRMKKVSAILNKYNIENHISNGTFYLYINAPKNFSSGDEFSRYLLENCGIFTIPWDEVEPCIRLSMTFDSTLSDEKFYLELDNRLKRCF